MTRIERLKRLRDVIAEIETLPESPERDRLLSEFRSRAVDIDTGVAPRGMLPMAEPAPDTERAPRRPRQASPPPETAVELPSPEAPPGRADRDDPFWVAEWLSLEEAQSPPRRTRDGRAVAPWTFGLRG